MSEVPTPADEARFWQLIESAWERTDPAANELRAALIGRGDDDEAYAIDPHLSNFLIQLERSTADLSSPELTALDRVLERKLFDLDRSDIHEFTDGSDDGFLYCRGFIVAMGKTFFDAVIAEPGVAVMDAECESMCYFFAHIHDKRFGDFPETGSGISRETGSNPTGWN